MLARTAARGPLRRTEFAFTVHYADGSSYENTLDAESFSAALAMVSAWYGTDDDDDGGVLSIYVVKH